jgi:hypothetical protein
MSFPRGTAKLVQEIAFDELSTRDSGAMAVDEVVVNPDLVTR